MGHGCDIVKDEFLFLTGTRTDKALQYVRHKIFNDEREGVPKIAVLLTDGASWYPDLTAHQADLLKQKNVTIMVVAISNKVTIAAETRLQAEQLVILVLLQGGLRVMLPLG